MQKIRGIFILGNKRNHNVNWSLRVDDGYGVVRFVICLSVCVCVDVTVCECVNFEFFFVYN